tara:strand:- start:295 stop:675 length:381 start_codon:yes stop_codon:yes gene_type:complete
MAEMGGKNPPRDLLKVTRVSVKVVSVGVEIPNPGCGFGTFCESSIKMPGLTEQFEGRWIVNLLDLAFRVTPTLWWANGHRVVPRGTGFEVEGHPSDGPKFVGAPDITARRRQIRASALQKRVKPTC